MTREIRWTKRAVRRLDLVGAHIARDDPEAAMRVVARIIAGVDLLAEQPAMGRVGRIKDTRELVFADIPYIVPYRVQSSAIEILTVMHTARKWPESL
ncbi:type II toxin-antitoxin system RelE/ParE family toxin [Pleomorphomonas carboxyditropha]|uniref:Type II toxin-antitoxin system mRNA interferase toxin, RelE/StbE family n=1 Tax=Pleomorphomonas carboxyditropha TaxID=2023338 RepID=A0A2G9WQG6_9HYPH|nr:type II toxin-antitoxin system RelE/ParE family toxin [Pleomorphomonas carboxyditropha]PIO96961.1 type II toxin-antitoxin system mRNA interferase toxin, RelE/StbE family [Pleomorphomonas carboxyditropha]